jgi:hypothetical protein
VSEDSPDKKEYSRRSRARACLRASKRGNFVGNQRFLKRYVGRKTKGDKPIGIAAGGSVNLSTSLSNVAKLAAHPKFLWVFNANCDGTIIYIDPVFMQNTHLRFNQLIL